MQDRYLHMIWLATVLVLFGLSGVLAAPNLISGIDLKHAGDNTIVAIHGDGPTRIAHQSVEAKEGMPFRIVIDCLAARHALPQKDFLQLPKSVITSIRTSQYSVKPEEVVRIVLDLEEESIYRVETEGNQARVYINDPQTASFASRAYGRTKPEERAHTGLMKKSPAVNRSAIEEAPVIAGSEAAETHAGVDHDRSTVSGGKPIPIQYKYGNLASRDDEKASVAVKSASSKPSDKATAVPAKQQASSVAVSPLQRTEEAGVDKKAVVSQSLSVKPEAQKQVDQAKQAASTQPVRKAEPTQADMLARKTKKFSSVPINVEGEPVVYGPFPPPGFRPVTSQAESGRDRAASPEVASAETEKQPPPVPGRVPGGGKVERRKADDKKQPLAQADTDKSSGTTTKATSRYRRSTAKTRRLKQTQVVQFPQRMVIKYGGDAGKDPFKSLITARVASDGGSSGMILDRIPNVETLNLVGILKSVEGRSAALMQDIEGIGYILKPGDRVQNGYVAQITNDAIYFQVNEYGWTRTVAKAMDKE